MPKIIKKKIKRSIPWLIIIALIGLTVSSAFFNFNISIYKNLTSNKLSLSIEVPQAEAQNDTASTTVTVKNAPPAFVVDPAEVPASTSTSPINVGGSITFTATADDPENNDYYLIICDSDSVIASTTGGPPTCGGTTFCVSNLTTDETQASCTYTNVADPGAETDDWYAFVCDNHSTEADCSSASQGTAPNIYASSSPIYINHAPSFTYVYTSDDNKDPGGTFTVTASTTDTDVLGGQDVLYLYVCSTNSWSTSTGCTADELCMGTSTSPNISCSFATSTPAPDGSWSYYAFVMDEHYFASPDNSKTNTYTVNNVAPIVSNVILNGGNDITLNMRGAPETVVVASSTVTDYNGCSDIVDATSTIYLSSVAGGANCTADDNNCYQIANTSCIVTNCSGAIANVTCSTTFAFYAVPTDAALTGNPNAADNWLAKITAYDEALSGASTTATGVDVNGTTALEVTQTDIAYGIIQAGQNTGTSTATTTIVNYGNTPVNSDLIGTDMLKDNVGPDLIAVNNQQFDLAYFYYGTGTVLSSTTPQTVDIDAARPTSTADVSDNIFWGIGIPVGTPSGDYYGENTFSAVFDSTGWFE